MVAKFGGNLSATAGLYGVKADVMDGYVALIKSGASVDDLMNYVARHDLPMTREEATRSVAEQRGR